MTVIPYWNMPTDELIREALLSPDELPRELGNRWTGREDDEVRLDELQESEATLRLCLADIYNAVGFAPGDEFTLWDAEDNLEDFREEIVKYVRFIAGERDMFRGTLEELTAKNADLERRLSEQLQTTPEVKEPAMSLETRMESLETRMGSLEGSNSKLVEVIERLIVALSNGPIPTAAARPRKSANTNKKEEPVTPPPATEEPAPAPAAEEEFTLDQVRAMLTELPREDALRLVNKYSPVSKVLSGVPAEKYPALVAEIRAFSQKEAA